MNKKLRYNVNETILVIAVLIAVILFNSFVGLLAQRFPLQIDFTKNKIYSLTEQSQDVLSSLDSKVNIYYLATASSKASGVLQVANTYKAESKYINFETHDPNADPAFVKRMAAFGISELSNGMIIAEYNGRTATIPEQNFFSTETDIEGNPTISGFQLERELTNAIARITRKGDAVTVYLSTGHDEIMASDLEEAFSDCNVTTRQINLATTPVPSDASALYIFGPQSDFTKEELMVLNSYLANGGNAAVFVNYRTQNLQNLYAFMKEYWGVTPANDIVLETNSALSQSAVSFYSALSEHAITSSLLSKYVLWSNSQSLTFDVAPGVTATPIIKTSESGASIDKDGNLLYENEEIPVAAILDILQQDETRSKVFVSGSTSVFAKEQLIEANLANSDLFNNLISYLSDQTLDIAPKRITVTSLVMSDSLVYIYIIIFGILPTLVALIFGLIVWLRRKNL